MSRTRKTSFAYCRSTYVITVHKVRQSESDADTQIVDEALEIACRGEAVTEMGQIFISSEPKKQQNLKLRNIGQIANCLDIKCTKNIFSFIHAWGGCDTTSATFNQGKTAILKLVEKGSGNVLDICSVFDTSSSTQVQITEAGINLFIMMYGKKTSYLCVDRKKRANNTTLFKILYLHLKNNI